MRRLPLSTHTPTFMGTTPHALYEVTTATKGKSEAGGTGQKLNGPGLVCSIIQFSFVKLSLLNHD